MVARRLSRWTTNLLASGLILVLALGVGRQLIGWWRIEPSAAGPQAAVDASLSGEAWLPSRLRFGDSPYEIEHRLAHGDRAAAIDQLAAACREQAASFAAPLPPLGEAERQLLAAVAELEPLATAGPLRLYGSLYGVPLVVAVAAPAEQDVVSPANTRQTEPEKPAESAPGTESAAAAEPTAGALGALRDRVLVWGMAAAAGADDWSLYLFRQRSGTAQATSQSPKCRCRPTVVGRWSWATLGAKGCSASPARA